MAFEHYVQSGAKQLRCGYTTGTCASLAAEGAVVLLLTGRSPKTVSLRTPKGWNVEVEPEFCEHNRCGVRKDAGDDPDVTDGMLVVATASFAEPTGLEPVLIDGGEGVGRVTKPGLDQPVGSAAINRVPRQMIRDAVLEVCDEFEYDPMRDGAIRIVISIPGGEEKARKTFNPKLGIQGGLSVLGTSGVVEPMSEQALKDTIAVELRQAYELQQASRQQATEPSVILTPGNYGSDFLAAHGWTELGVPIVKISNYVGDSLDAAVSIGFRQILLVGHIGKLVKVAGNIMNTHSAVADARMELLTAHAAILGASRELAEQLMAAATTDAALDLLEQANLKEEVMRRIGDAVQKNLKARAQKALPTERKTSPAEKPHSVGTEAETRASDTGNLTLGTVIFSNTHGVLTVTEPAAHLIKLWKETKDDG